MEVYIENRQSDVPITLPYIKKIVRTVIEQEGHTCHEVSCHFVTEEEITSLHKTFFGKSSATDCISLPIDGPNEPYRVLGEVFICPKTAIRYATKHSTDIDKEVILYLIHSLLHLMGYKDKTDEEKLYMREAEKKHLDYLYPDEVTS